MIQDPSDALLLRACFLGFLKFFNFYLFLSFLFI